MLYVLFLYSCIMYCFFFFFQAEDGIRDHCVTGVQTCALPISSQPRPNCCIHVPIFETTRPIQNSRKSRCSSADHAEVRPGSAAVASSSPSVSSSGARSSAVICESAWESNPPRNVLRPVNGFEDRGTHRSPRTL